MSCHTSGTHCYAARQNHQDAKPHLRRGAPTRLVPDPHCMGGGARGVTAYSTWREQWTMDVATTVSQDPHLLMKSVDDRTKASKVKINLV